MRAAGATPGEAGDVSPSTVGNDGSTAPDSDDTKIMCEDPLVIQAPLIPSDDDLVIPAPTTPQTRCCSDDPS